jgi:hypothetical protein
VLVVIELLASIWHDEGGKVFWATSGSGRMIAGAYPCAGTGDVVTAVKPGEIAVGHYVGEHRRKSSLVLLDESYPGIQSNRRG